MGMLALSFSLLLYLICLLFPHLSVLRPPTLARWCVIYYFPCAPFHELVSVHISAFYHISHNFCDPKGGGKKESD